MEARIRQNQDILKISGKALIILGLWTIVRLFLLRFLEPELLHHFLTTPDMEYTDPVIYDILFSVVIIALVIDLVFRLFIGLSSISEGKGKKKTPVYIIFAILYALVCLSTDIYVIATIPDSQSKLSSISSLLIDLTSCLALVAITVSSISIRVLRKKSEKATAA